jgi:hypothetical protein
MNIFTFPLQVFSALGQIIIVNCNTANSGIKDSHNDHYVGCSDVG